MTLEIRRGVAGMLSGVIERHVCECLCVLVRDATSGVDLQFRCGPLQEPVCILVGV
jgi:hypothetical protein